ncbi:uncharacterized protein EV420DRAFT_307121 [Desarmillaria tabescens]|uniref:BTB domain-containing protein n=1 Tax=Armillaria tabescens TaxID=1929756 RepID=A0AA39KDI9_ARMTA|nr:uncharacterized protein EV420DRAFT_307121 [Desarmillaria tabescens]KAK0459179.1 hypothetical protein EV420DRAFT_307121 [Desarmillaria tabescens]
MITTVSLALNVKTYGFRLLEAAKSLIFHANDNTTRKVIHNSAFYWQNAVIQVGTQLFKVPIRDFEESAFWEELDLTGGKGSHDDDPIVLEGVSSAEFESLLRVIHMRHSDSGKLELHVLTSALKLSTNWQLIDARNKTIQQLHPMICTNFAVLVDLGTTYFVLPWLQLGLYKLVERGTCITGTEATYFRRDSILKVWEAQERVREGGSDPLNTIFDVFSAEIRKVERESNAYGAVTLPGWPPERSLVQPTKAGAITSVVTQILKGGVS